MSFLLFYSPILPSRSPPCHLVLFVIFKLPSEILVEFGYMSILPSTILVEFGYMSICSLGLFSLLWHGLFILPKFLNFHFYLDYLIHSRIKSKLNQYVFTLSALDPSVYILAYDFDLHSVLVLFNASLYKRM